MQSDTKKQSSELSKERCKFVCHLYSLAWDANLTIGRFLYANKTATILGDFNKLMRDHFEAVHVLIGRNRLLILRDWNPIIHKFENHILAALRYGDQALSVYEQSNKLPEVGAEDLAKIESEFSSTLDDCSSIFTNFLETFGVGVFINPTHHNEKKKDAQNPFLKISRVISTPEIDQGIRSHASILNRMSKLVAGMILVMIEHELASGLRTETLHVQPEMSYVLVPLFSAITNSTNTLIGLSDGPGPQTRDCYSIARSIVELCVNACYIMSNGPEMAKKAMRHAQQKKYREMEQETRIGSGKLKIAAQGRPEIEEIPGLREAIDEFSNARGKAKDWTDKKLEERIASVGKHASDGIQGHLDFARFMIYREASEVLHGSLYSTLHFWGVSEHVDSHDEYAEAKWIAGQHELILLSAISAQSACIETFHRLYGFESAEKRRKKILNDLTQLKKI